MFEFQHIEFLPGLLAMVPLALLFFYVLKWKQKTKKALGDERLINQLTRNYSPRKYKLKIAAILVAITLLIIAAANFRKPDKAKGGSANGIDVMIALDVSKSMLSQDEKPTRLDKARQLIYQLTQHLEGNRLGLVVFAGQAYLQMPLTPDAAAARMFVSNASPELVAVQGTNLSDALHLSDASLDTKEKKYKTVILITDGEDHEDKAIDAAKELADHGTVLHTIGVGSAEGVPITEPGSNDYKRDENGQTVISKLNEGLLQQLATTANGTYHKLDNTTAVADELTKELNAMEKKAISNQDGYRAYTSFYPLFLGVAVALLIAEVFISERKNYIA